MRIWRPRAHPKPKLLNTGMKVSSRGRVSAEGFKLSAGFDQFSVRYHSWVDVILEIFFESSFGQVSRQGRYEYVWKGDSRLCGAQNLVGMGGNIIS